MSQNSTISLNRVILEPVHGPIHASWLNQIEIDFSIVQRKALTPNDFASLEELEQRLLGFQRHYEVIAEPFEWKFTRRDLAKLLDKIPTRSTDRLRAAQPQYCSLKTILRYPVL